MGRVGKMEELQNLAVFLISGGCDWINGETIAMDGAQALATGGNFYELRDWSDADWTRARDSIKAQNEKDRAARGLTLSSLRKQGAITTGADCYEGNQLYRATDKAAAYGSRFRRDNIGVLSLARDDTKLRATNK